MRIAIFSDIHSNLQALDRALQESRKHSVDEICCLGDIVGYGANPNECVDLIRSHATLRTLGNHDQAALDTSYADYFTGAGRIAANWTHEVLTPTNAQFLSSMPLRIVHKDYTLVHANPQQPESWRYLFTREDARSQFPHFQTTLCLVGHTHIPLVCGEHLETFEYQKGSKFLINVGSIGQPRDGNPQLSFGIFDSDAGTYANIRLDYDIGSAADAIRKNGLPRFLADRLFKGV